MTPEEYERIRECFLVARELEGAERSTYLAEVTVDQPSLREEVEKLLVEDAEGGDFLRTPALGEGFALDEVARSGAVPIYDTSGETLPLHPSDRGAVTQVPDLIGDYRILDVLGVGGMGIVYRAEQDHPRRIVALKVIRPGHESEENLRRFQHEAQVLAYLVHPGIAQIYDAGMADTGSGPQPYFALELVQGEPLSDYACEMRLTVRQRLELVARVCDAVHYAHQKGVIHRDLKPGNILVDTSGQPKVLDFGVARMTDADIQATVRTGVGQVVGTIAYMSPEQITGDPRELDTRSDIFALGTIIYELLAGCTPVDTSDISIPEAVRRIIEVDPVPLRTRDRTLNVDVETIVAKALEKEKDRRYASAAALAADIRHYLADEPITARPATTFYQFRKFARRNRMLVATIAIALVAVAGGFVHVVWERDRAIRAERQAGEHLRAAEAEAAKVKIINQFYNDMLRSADPERDGRDIRVVDVLDKAASDLSDQFTDQPVLEAALKHTIGAVYVNLGLFEQALPFLESAHATQMEVLGQEDADTLATQMTLANTLEEHNRLQEAEDLVRGALEARERSLGAEHPETLSARNNLGEVLYRLGRLEEAETVWRRTLEAQERLLEPDDPDLLITMNNMAQVLRHLGRPRECAEMLRNVLKKRMLVSGEEHPHTLACMNNLAMALKTLGELDEAEVFLRRVIEVRKRTLGDHPDVHSVQSNLSRLLIDRGRLEDAEVLAREVYEGNKRLVGENHAATMISANNLASLWVQMGRVDDAEAIYVDTLARARDVLPEGHHLTLIIQRNLGECLTAMERYEEAEDMLLASHEGLASRLGANHRHTVRAKEMIHALYVAWGRDQEAAAWSVEGADQP